MTKKIANVLFIEDSAADIALTKAFLKRENIKLNIQTIRDGDEAVIYIKDNKQAVTETDVIFLDFNLPKKNGIEVLKFIKNNNDTKHIPVIMLTGSDAPSDIERARAFNIVDYIIKPLDYQKITKVIKDIPTLELQEDGQGKYLYARS